MDKSCTSESMRSLIILNEGEKLNENLLCMLCEELVIDPMECKEC